MSNKVRTINDGEYVFFPFKKKGLICCCDCELTHEVKITQTKKGKGVMMQFWRESRRTAQRRRRKREKG